MKNFKAFNVYFCNILILLILNILNSCSLNVTVNEAKLTKINY